MNSLGLILITIFVAMILFGSRKVAFIGLFGIVCYVPLDQQVNVGGFHFTSSRTALLIVFIRNVARGEFRQLIFNGIDKALLGYVAVLTLVGILREGTLSQVVFCFGKAYDVIFSYAACRCLIPSFKEAKTSISSLALMIVPLSVLMLREALTTNSAFAAMGVERYLDMRHGLCRAQGPFQSPILAGVFGATLIPLFVGIYPAFEKHKVLLAGIAASMLITISTVSSAPILAIFLGGFCMFCWPIRERMKTVRWGIVGVIVGLQMVMKADVWFIFGRLGSLTGGGGEYRSELLDSAIRDIGHWWLLGFSDTGKWTANHLANGSADITSQYIRDAVDGGIWALLLFVVLLTKCFSGLGKARKKLRFEGNSETDFGEEWFLWCLGCALFVHVVTIFSVEYFDQIKVSWYMLLAMISGLTSDVLARELGSKEVSGDGSVIPFDAEDSEGHIVDSDGRFGNLNAI